MARYYDRDGTALTLDQWSLAFSKEKQRVAADSVGDYRVSTVWLGLDHQYGDGPPLIFETMIFGGDYTDLYCERYATEAEAQAGHAAVVSRLRDGTLELRE